jgi:hypothetical protein
MEWVEFERAVSGVRLMAFQPDGRLSSELATDSEIDHAISELKRQLDQTATRAKAALKHPRPLFDRD